jgi:hypothetical protein
MSESTHTYGLLIRTVHEYGMRKVIVEVLRRNAGESHPINCHGDRAADKLRRADLTLYGWVSDYTGKFSLMEPCYLAPHSVEAADARAMVKTLDKINAAIAKAEAREAGDVFIALAKAVGAQWIAEPRRDKYCSYSDTEWYWRSLGDGRDAFRRKIAEAEAAHAEAKGHAA